MIVFEKKTILVPFFYDNIIMGAYLKFWYSYPEFRAPLCRIHLHSISPDMVVEIKPRLLIF